MKFLEQELRLKQPKHKRLEYVAGWDIHQLIKGENSVLFC